LQAPIILPKQKLAKAIAVRHQLDGGGPKRAAQEIRAMNIPIKIQCGCGQRYAFDVEPVDGQMPASVACPVCGADGTAAANGYIAQTLPVVAAPAGVVRLSGTPPAPSVRVAAPAAAARAAAPRTAGLLPGQVDRAQAVTEARAKIFWGDPPEEVIKFLMRQGSSVVEARELVAAMFQERAKTIRRNGIVKFFLGTTMACVPVAFYLVCTHMGVLPMKLFGLTIMVGLWGAYMLLKGLIMFFAPKSEPGDVAAQ